MQQCRGDANLLYFLHFTLTWSVLSLGLISTSRGFSFIPALNISSPVKAIIAALSTSKSLDGQKKFLTIFLKINLLRGDFFLKKKEAKKRPLKYNGTLRVPAKNNFIDSATPLRRDW
jgi:hypothetical protein